MKEYRQKIATYISLAFHVSGFIAIAVYKSSLFISLTPLNLLVSAVLIFWTQEKINTAFLAFVIFSCLAGFFAEYTGINTGYLFGNYKYGSVLGYSWNGVPLIIGLQWMVTLYCIGISMSMLHDRLNKARLQQEGQKEDKAAERKWRILKMASILLDGALLAVFFDWAIEPAAIKLGFWKWSDGEVPLFNYYSWALVSLPILAVFYFLRFKKQNLFAVNLLLIQFMFFLLVNRFY
jgi:putative membrane protein